MPEQREGSRLRHGVAIRRAPLLLSYWSNGCRVVVNYATGVSHALVDDTDALLLDRLGEWTTVEQLRSDVDAPDIDARLERLLARTQLEVSNRPARPAEGALADWGDWNPAAGFFHFSTRDVETVDSRESRELDPMLVTDAPCPDHLKRYEGARVVQLATVDESAGPDALRDALLTRRTWRRFGSQPPTLLHVSTLLALTWRVQHWLHVESGFRMPLKTAPSGGARHSIEVYVLARSVDGLEPATYHYCPDRHVLERMEAEPASEAMPRLVRQTTYHEVPVMFVMTSVFGRVQWRYRHPRAYRVVLLEAGHHAQSFCLLATALGLAPFTTASFTDSAIERHLGLDGVREAPVYIVGVGTRPEGVEWAPYEWTERVPELRPPTWRGEPER